MTSDEWVNERAARIVRTHVYTHFDANEPSCAPDEYATYQAISAFGQECISRARSEERALAAEALKLAYQRERRLREALHDAIRRPLGVTPDTAVPFYDQRMADEAEQRRLAAHLDEKEH